MEEKQINEQLIEEIKRRILLVLQREGDEIPEWSLCGKAEQIQPTIKFPTGYFRHTIGLLMDEQKIVMSKNWQKKNMIRLAISD